MQYKIDDVVLKYNDIQEVISWMETGGAYFEFAEHYGFEDQEVLDLFNWVRQIYTLNYM
jgi:hypothetical protein